MTKRKGLSEKTRFEVFKRDSFKCQYCGSSAPEVVLHVDHIKPVAKGGKNEITNLVTSCSSCNQGKGARTLDDNTAVEKQRRQLEELNERRTQLEMMMKWREGLSEIEDKKFEYAREKWGELSGYTLSELGIKELKKVVKKYPLEMVLDSIEISSLQYLEEDKEGGYTKRSVEKAFNYISRICANKTHVEDKLYLKDLYYIRGILNHRLGYVNQKEALSLLEKAYQNDADIEQLKRVAKGVRNWTQFADTMESFIRGEDDGALEEY